MLKINISFHIAKLEDIQAIYIKFRLGRKGKEKRGEGRGEGGKAGRPQGTEGGREGEKADRRASKESKDKSISQGILWEVYGIHTPGISPASFF